jgi:hypothetical protein
MNAWTGLLKKDFRLTRTVFFVGIVINILLFMLAMFVDRKSDEPLYMLIPLLAAIFLHVFYFPIVLFISLKTEGNQLHLWLHNSQSAVTLLCSKILNVTLKMIVSLVILYGMLAVLVLPNFHLFKTYWTDIWVSSLLLFPHIILFSISMGIWVIFFWSLYHYMRIRIGRWSGLVVIAAVILLVWIVAQFESTQLYMLITHWGGMDITFMTFSNESIHAYMGEYLYNLIVIIGVFYLSAWLIDNKVEV